MGSESSEGWRDPWWTRFFDEVYARVALYESASDPANLARTVEFLVEKLGVRPGDTIFDQCCGVGRLALRLGRAGCSVIGVEQNENYVREANALAAAESLQVRIDRGDAREYVCATPCDAGFNWFTSFGYELDDRENRRMLDAAFASLRSGAWFALDYFNVPRILRDFQAHHVQRHVVDGNTLLVFQEAQIDFRDGMIHTDWTFSRPGGAYETRRVSTRAYMPHELVRLFEAAGFVAVGICGDVDQRPLDRSSSRCVVVGRRP